MASIIVRVPAQLRGLTGGTGEIPMSDVSTVGEVLKHLTVGYSELGSRIFDDEGNVRRFVNVFVADEDIRFNGGLECPVADGQVVSIVPAVAGGAI
ncbi:MAG: MoaD/ThiS family protein [Acidimicrobiales bacterium]